MLRKARLIFSFLLVFVMMGCVSDQPVVDNATSMGVRQEKMGWSKVFHQNYDSIWRAAQITMKYPVAVNNIDNGILESEWVRAEDGFLAPSEKAPPAGTRYKITIIMVKGNSGGKSSARLTIQKTVEKHRDFFSDAETLSSDGLEEKMILYRIDRELTIEDAIKKSSATTN